MNKKTAEEILKETKYTMFGRTKLYDEEDVLPAMETYAAQFKSEWVSVDERLPEPNVRVLVYSKVHKDHLISEIDEKGRWWQTYTLLNGVTHWQPLPTPPKK